MKDSILEIYKKDIWKSPTMTARKKRILEASIDLFSKNGYSNTSTNEIAKMAGVAEGTIFKHFGTKEKLLLTLIVPFVVKYTLPQTVLELKNCNTDIKEVYPDFRTFIHGIVFEISNFINENHKIAHILFAEILYREDLRMQIIESLSPVLSDSFYYIFDYFKKEKMIKEFPNEFILRTILSHIGSYATIKFLFHPTKSYDEEKELKYIEESIINAFSLKI